MPSADEQDLFDLVRRERFARDQRRFDVMAGCFHPGAWVRTTWYDGVGGQAYVEATRSLLGDAPAGPFSGKHWVFPAFAQVDGDRATVESPAKIFLREEVGGIQADVHAYCRFFSRAVRSAGSWKLLTFHVLFEWDELRPVVPGEVPDLDVALLAGLRPSYRYLGYLQTKRGVQLNLDLLGDDRWAELVAFHAREDAWLAGEGPIDDPT
ncbi:MULTISPECIES: nuclear transport factor 2 family protein [unclassified Modestobacter]|uniref:nuclear transport factor 2 family protein n=1 Tax=unclassified Modestobacter TaxID=2643866 RepID=UPI0022AAE127|nr:MULTISPECIES: nuclear transport factor 2 family protein [unclassified Modestobacter]MCZ2826693.1 nuclear transport factor 2 family protein [Modestobacter sp. VKM Ac-2981]MCZ2855073.1 nuclear transport factor 2 family protein [Modestobacter sp. VKM Ac-2982]